MLFYDRVNATVPEGIEHKTAHIIGGGIAGLAAAAFLASDAHMPAGNITVYEDLSVPGGAMDAVGDPSAGYVCRGERELEAHMECLWYLYSKVPSLKRPGRTVLDETREFELSRADLVGLAADREAGQQGRLRAPLALAGRGSAVPSLARDAGRGAAGQVHR